MFASRIFTLVAALVFSAIGNAAIVKKSVDYNLAGKKYEGYIAYDDAKKGLLPGILVAHNWMGVTDETKSKVDQLAELGYVAFAVDIYGKDVRPKNTEEAAALAGGFKKDRVPLRNRMHQGLKVLKEQKNVDKTKIAVVGYCFGGTAALELGRAGGDVKAIVTFHGGLDSPKPADGAKIKAHVLVLHGADDPFVPAPDVAAFEDEMRKNKVDWELVKYGGAVHSFTEKGAGNDNSKGAAYNASADKRSWQAMRTFLTNTL
ncbi:dienelactone hydrolase family protein [soil metagenome]